MYFCRESQIAVRHLEPLFRGLATANKFVEATGTHLAEILPLLGTREGLGTVTREDENGCSPVVDCTATRKMVGGGPTYATPEE